MINKTNILAAAIVATAALSIAPSANAGIAAGMSATTQAATTAAITTTPAGIVLAHGYGGHWHGYGGWRPHGGFRRCRWLKRRARRTGRPYWWHRYYRCRSAYYF